MTPATGGTVIDDEMRRRADLLARVPLLAGFSPDERARVAERCRELVLSKGAVVCREGDAGDTLFVVASGELEVWTGAPPRLLGHVGAGGVVGEITLLLGGPRSATVLVTRLATLLAIDRATFDDCLACNARALEHLSRVLCQRLIATSRRESATRPTRSVAVVAQPGRRGRTLVAAALAGLLRDMTGRPTLHVTVHEEPPRGRGRSRRPARAALAADAAAPHVVPAPAEGEPARLALTARSPDGTPRIAAALGTALTRLADAFPTIVVQSAGDTPSIAAAIGECCDWAVEIGDDVGVAGPAPDPAPRLRTLRVVNLFDADHGPLPLNHCEPFVLPDDGAVVALDPWAAAARVRTHPALPFARPLHRLARKILGTTVGVALGGGAAFGLAHVGVFSVLAEHGIPIDLVAGSSMGSIIALAYAAGMPPDAMVDVARRIGTPWTTLSALDFTLGKPGLLAGDRLVAIMRPLFGGAETFADLHLPCRTVAADIECGARVTIGSGPLAAAFRASCAVPMVWPPVRHDGRVLVDGAVVDPVPAEVVREMGADVCIAVNVVPPLKRGVTTVLSRLYRAANFLNPLSHLAGARDLPNLFDVVMNSMQTLQHELGNFKAISADVRINPDLSHLTWIEFYKPNELIERGRLAAEAAVEQVQRVLAARVPRPRADPAPSASDEQPAAAAAAPQPA